MAPKTNTSRSARKTTPRRPAKAAPVEDATPEGFRRKPNLFTLEFGDGEWAGMRVSFRPMRYRVIFEGGLTMDWAAGGATRDEFLDGLRRTSEAAASVLESWNLLDDDGEPVPATLEGLLSLDQDHGLKIVLAWAFRAIGVSAPLGAPSSSGGTSPEASIPMETLSPNPDS
ncbi:MAG TPA: hypothetical protein VFQ42_04005 [Mycobacterium sp.]|nr:hypothetical protein [Mycobacterium sp.]